MFFRLVLLQTGLGKHFLKLAASTHVDGLGYHLTVAVVDKTFRDAFDDERVIHFASGIEQNGLADLAFRDERRDLGHLFVGDREHQKSLIFVLVVKSL